MKRRGGLALSIVIIACGDEAVSLPAVEDSSLGVSADAGSTETFAGVEDGASMDAEGSDTASVPIDAAEPFEPDAGPPEEPEVLPLIVRYLGQGGFSLTYRGERILTAPMYSNPSMGSVLTGTIAADPPAIERFLGHDADDARAILVGHAHYDHLMDVPWVWQHSPEAHIYGTVDTKRVLAAYAPDRPAHCPVTESNRPQIPRDKVVALNDPSDDRVDYRLCAEPESDCTGAYDGRPGAWIPVPGSSRIRIRALCSAHAPQFLSFHFGAGCIDEELCDPPTRAADWREGGTLAYLIDFLSLDGTRILHRIYYQDAPTDGPVGFVSPDLLAEKRVDVALLCVGGYDQVDEHPQAIISALNPRFVIAGHWESLFRQPDQSIQRIPFLDVDEFERRLQASMPPNTAWMPNPGTESLLEAE